MARRFLLVVGFTIGSLSFAGFRAATQSQEVLNAEQRFVAQNLERRLNALEQVDVPGRLRVLESDMTEVKWLARGAMGFIVAQVLAITFKARQRGRNDVA